MAWCGLGLEYKVRDGMRTSAEVQVWGFCSQSVTATSSEEKQLLHQEKSVFLFFQISDGGAELRKLENKTVGLKRRFNSFLLPLKPVTGEKELLHQEKSDFLIFPK
jgi:hypothetical protein